MSKKKLSKLLALHLPYVVIGLLATNLGEHGGWLWARNWAIRSCP